MRYSIVILAMSAVWADAAPPLVPIPAGTYNIGFQVPSGTAGGLNKENCPPVRNLYEVDAFGIGKYEVSNAEFCDVMNWGLANQRLTIGAAGLMYGDLVVLDLRSGYARIEAQNGRLVVKEGFGKHPVVEVTWHGAMLYCALLNDREGLPQAVDLKHWTIDHSQAGYRLPTEVEWTIVACDGKTPGYKVTVHPSNPELVPAQGHMLDNVALDACHIPHQKKQKAEQPTGTLPCGSLPPQGFGAHDLIGNVWEWCADSYVTPETIYYQTRNGIWDNHGAKLRKDWTPKPDFAEIPKNPVFDEAHRAALERVGPFKPARGVGINMNTSVHVNLGGAWTGVGGYRWALESLWYRRDDRPELSTGDLGFRVARTGYSRER